MVWCLHGHRPQQGPQVTKNKNVSKLRLVAATASPNTPSLCRACAALPPDEWQPMELFKISRTSWPSASSRTGWGHVPAKKNEELSNVLATRRKRRRTGPFPLCIIKLSWGDGEKKERERKKKSRTYKKINCQRG